MRDMDATAKKIESLSELDAKVLLIRTCTTLERHSDDWNDGLEEIENNIDLMLK